MDIKTSIAGGPHPMAHATSDLSQDYYTTRDLAELLHLTQTTVRHLAEQGLLPRPIRLGRNVLRWRRDAIRRFLESREAGKDGAA
jgi:excisionase family DNA binding protein